jgi:succinate-acetate transporter protein
VSHAVLQVVEGRIQNPVAPLLAFLLEHITGVTTLVDYGIFWLLSKTMTGSIHERSTNVHDGHFDVE